MEDEKLFVSGGRQTNTLHRANCRYLKNMKSYRMATKNEKKIFDMCPVCEHGPSKQSKPDRSMYKKLLEMENNL